MTTAFGDHALRALSVRHSSETVHPALRGGRELVSALVVTASLIVPVCFVRVSLGASATGTIVATGSDADIVAPRDGILLDVAGTDHPFPVDRGRRLARIRALDPVGRTGLPVRTFSEAQLRRHAELLKGRRSEIIASADRRRESYDRMALNARDLARELEQSATLLTAESERLKGDLERAQQSLSDGIVPKGRVDDIAARLADRRLQIRANALEMHRVEQRLDELQQERLRTEEADRRALFEIADALLEIDTRARSLEDTELINVLAPRGGELVPRHFRPGQTVSAGETLYRYLADADDLAFHADIPAEQVGDLREGQAARIAVTAYPLFEHGFIAATVERLSTNPIEPADASAGVGRPNAYRLILRPDPTSLRLYTSDRPLMPGMTIEAHVRRDRVALWELLFDPLLRAASRLRE